MKLLIAVLLFVGTARAVDINVPFSFTTKDGIEIVALDGKGQEWLAPVQSAWHSATTGVDDPFLMFVAMTTRVLVAPVEFQASACTFVARWAVMHGPLGVTWVIVPPYLPVEEREAVLNVAFRYLRNLWSFRVGQAASAQACAA